MDILPHSFTSPPSSLLPLLPTPSDLNIAIPVPFGSTATSAFPKNTTLEATTIARPIPLLPIPYQIIRGQIFAICLLAVSALGLIVGLAYLYRVSLAVTKEKERELGLEGGERLRWEIEAMTPSCDHGDWVHVGYGDLDEEGVTPLAPGEYHSDPGMYEDFAERPRSVGGSGTFIQPRQPPPVYQAQGSRREKGKSW
ncbi:hypothetical protein BDN72DRAFT_837039 [Pluteus cervinus]|uniref:Uncharacterized protein n=1 Tax=Pluteus cervinus TaxID=181527 RepID=A0ACD3B1K2_9AGAR|nr:hypothetical protein BDN72DRAFT_837039 [Pluteus cervinus]